MNLKEMIEQDNKKASESEHIKNIQKGLIENYEKNINLGKSILDKLTINKSYRDEVHQLFLDNGLQKSDTDHEGNNFISSSTTYYKYENTCIAVSFAERSETEDIIEIIRPVEKSRSALIYKLDDNLEKILYSKFIPKLNNEFIGADNYKEKIIKCNSIEELTKLDNQIKEDNKQKESNLSKNINFVGVYQLQDDRQFKSFAEAFESL